MQGRRTSLKVIAGIVILVVLILVVIGLSGGKGRLQVGDEVPAFSVELYDGGEFRYPASGAKVVVIHFWASWCHECEKDMPGLNRVWRDFRDEGVLVVGVSYKDVEGKAKDFIQSHGVQFPCGKDPKARVAAIFGVTGVPETYVIAPDGTLAYKRLGAVSEEELRLRLEDLLR